MQERPDDTWMFLSPIRAILVHSLGAEGGVGGAEIGVPLGAAAGEAILPPGGGVVGAVAGGVGGSYIGATAFEGAGNWIADQFGVGC